MLPSENIKSSVTVRYEEGVEEAGKRSLVVLSGGLDSTTALALAINDNGRHKVETLSFVYGQRHDIEVQVAHDIAAYFAVPHFIQDIQLGKGGVLMHHDHPMPQMTYEEIATAEGPSATYVPYRNGTFLSHAASHALERECELIYCGMHAEDAHNWAYPDCTPEFIGAMQNAIFIGSYYKVRLVAPFTNMVKTDIIQLGRELGVPFERTHSCYEGARPACGRCPTCVARLEAFKELKLNDPLEYDFDAYRRYKD